MAAKQFHFITGLPRSGSTLLSALLRQNPDIYAGITSPLASLFFALERQMGVDAEYFHNLDNARRARLLRGLIENFYADVSSAAIFDTNRLWSMKVGALHFLFPSARLVCCVRPLPEIINSFERAIRRNPLIISKMAGFNPRLNIYERSEHWMAPGGLIGHPYTCLKEAYYGPYSGKLMLVEYERLQSNPSEVIADIYDFLNLPRFNHNFEDVQFSAVDFDLLTGAPGLHSVRPVVARADRPIEIPPDIVKRYSSSMFWRSDPASGTFLASVSSVGEGISRADAEPTINESAAKGAGETNSLGTSSNN